MPPEKPPYRFTGALPEALAPLMARKQWICWDYIWNEKKEKWDKPPLSAHTGRMAKGGATNPDNWGTFEQAAATVQRLGLAGIGYVISKDDNITGVDLDRCISDSGSYTAIAAEVLGYAETYAEISPSGEGVRLFLLGKYGGTVIKKDALGVEVYTWGRYLTVTGDQVGGSPNEIGAGPRTLAYLERIAGSRPSPEPRTNGHAKPTSTDFFANVNAAALTRLDDWVPVLHPKAKKQATGAWRITSKDLGRDLEEDLAYHPDGIRDHGEEIGFTAVDAVLKYGTPENPSAAALWLCQQMRVEPAALGFKAKRTRAPEPHAEPTYTGPELSIGQVVRTFRRWLRMGRNGDMPLLAMLGAVAANRLEGRPVWLAIVGPPSTSKTELLDAIAHLPDVHEASSLTPAGLLSATPKKSREADAKGGILNQIGKYGIITFKDFTTILSMRRETMAEVLAALREIYDGKWKRSVGSDGGREFRWKGKVGAIIGVTEAIDSHHGVMAQMGERFVMLRISDSAEEQLMAAFDHTGEREALMKHQLTEAVSGLFANKIVEPQVIGQAEKRRVSAITWLAVRLRAPVERDRQNREIVQVYRVEGPSRLGLTLERLLAGLVSIGVSRRRAFQIIEKVAFDSVPPVRLKVYRLLEQETGRITTTDVGTAVGLPTTTVRRALEDLEVHGIVTRTTEEKAHQWELRGTRKNLTRNVPPSQERMSF